MNNCTKQKLNLSDKQKSRIRQVACLEKVSKKELAYEDYKPKQHISARVKIKMIKPKIKIINSSTKMLEVSDDC